MSVLDEIAAATRRRLERMKAELPLETLRERALASRRPLDFAAALMGPGLRVIAEVKLASPSEGDIGKGQDPVSIARDYAAAGAAAISVLTEPEYFKGSLEHLEAVRKEVGLPLLMKDFVLDEYQLFQARALGADCVLLIVALLGERLPALLQKAGELGLSALVEVHDEAEFDAAVAAGARLIGVNNRDLKTLKVDLATSKRLAGRPGFSSAFMVCESGVSARSEMEGFAALGYRGFLIGSHLIKTGQPGRALRDLFGTKTKVKICGVTRPEDAALAASLGAWAIGLIFARESKRTVTLEQAARVSEALPSGVLRVGVFVDASIVEIRAIDKALRLDLVQLHGAASPEAGREFGTERCIRTIDIASRETPSRVAGIPAAYLLIDRPRLKGDPQGPRPKLELVAELVRLRPETMLAGGLTPENVIQAIRATRPYGVDVAGGVESAPGIKDADKMRAFFAAVRAADAEPR